MRRLAVLVAVVVYAFVAPVQAQTAFDRMMEEFKLGNYGTAAERLETMLEGTPDWPTGCMLLGRCYFQLGRPERAEEQFRLAAELDPESGLFEAYYVTGKSLLEQRRFDEAVVPLRGALRHAAETQRPPTALSLAYAQLQAGDAGATRETLEQHHARHERRFESSYYLALACQQLGDYDCALTELRAAARFGSDPQALHKVLAYLAEWSSYWAAHPRNKSRRAALQQRTVTDTRSWYAAAPREPLALRYYTEALIAGGQATDAVELLLPLVQHDPLNCPARALLAAAYNTVDDGRSAQHWAGVAIACDPSMADAHVELAAGLIRQLRCEHSSLAQVERDQDVLLEALAAIEQAARLDDRASRAATLRDDVQATMRQLEAAAADFAANDVLVDGAKVKHVLDRCRAIVWKIRGDTEALSAEEERFNRKHDCVRLVRE